MKKHIIVTLTFADHLLDDEAMEIVNAFAGAFSETIANEMIGTDLPDDVIDWSITP